ncbi:hypothetical protein FHS83_001562 [Rhizomicrobium palustre]|uniref:Alpha-galactosidase n=1 Tax=Rhizomicrobium palustre TaxID=189966 RepID=A0A846MXF2_9PROT|nr:NPCBM/NEW2 domain-containing protein [Rhizomicrobium palustre]NIK88244.1 hypothetical protein [Rhizomicrobium palustre]
MAKSAVALLGLMLCCGTALAGPSQLTPSGQWTAYQHGAAATPPMGWSSWNTFATNISEDRILGVADAVVKTGLAAKGYRYINLDDGWWAHRRQPDGRMQIRADQFPSAAVGGAEETSFKPFTDKLHKMGLKAGIYSDLGRNSCSQAYPSPDGYLPKGSVEEREIALYGHIKQDVTLYFKTWGFDFLKVDACGIRDYAPGSERTKEGRYRVLDPLIYGWNLNNTNIAGVRDLYHQVAEAIETARPNDDFIFSVCSWGSSDVRSWGKNVGNISRTSDDLGPNWSRMLHNFDSSARRPLYGHPGGWNDPDMLYVGYGDFDAQHLTEAKSHFAMWAIINAPLILGNDIRAMQGPLLDIVGNSDVIALNQDKAGNQATIAFDAEDVQIFVKTLANGKKAVAVFNRGQGAMDVDLTAEHLKLAADSDITLTDLWTKQQSHFRKETKLALASRETKIFLVDGKRRLEGGFYLSEIPGRVNPAEDGVTVPMHDPLVHRHQAWIGTHGTGAHPQYGGWGGAQVDQTPYGQTIALGGKPYDTGIGILSNSRLEVKNAGAKLFTAEVGVDDSTPDKSAPVIFSVYGDGKLLYKTAPKAFGEKPESLNVKVKGVKIIELVATSTASVVTAWGNAALVE